MVNLASLFPNVWSHVLPARLRRLSAKCLAISWKDLGIPLRGSQDFSGHVPCPSPCQLIQF
ncbi:hypothetical protein BV25DRAFT_1833580 [Artomyces pyxidatus]|uniref:Uncharacterized protein n=1 Tax=Artomyces pyxidatus TaxID=48021 RepID=A0ACB8SEK6_9AGAM|nr:hypothetical protein BV25DRAFT_1833580 [Artomyces pyxidatus]